MSDTTDPKHHHTLRERLDAAHAAADEVVAEEGGQIGGEVSALAVPFEEIAAAVRAAIHPDSLGDDEVIDGDSETAGEEAGAVGPEGD